MSTFIEIIPTVDDTKKITAIRLDDDFRCTIRLEEPGKSPNDIQRNYTGLEEGDQLDGARVEDPVQFVRVTKLGTDARCVIGVKVYHELNQQHTVPNAGLYWYPWKTQVDPNPILRAAKGEEDPVTLGTPTAADDPSYEGTATQTWATIYNISTEAALDAYNSQTPVSFTADTTRMYAKLVNNDEDKTTEQKAAATLDNRRRYLKGLLLRNHLAHPDRDLWFEGSSSPTAITEVLLRPRVKGYIVWMEMMARAISVNDNFDTEQKFNLLEGDCQRSGSLFVRNARDDLLTAIAGDPALDTRSTWNFIRIGNAPAISPYEYVAPSNNPSNAAQRWGGSGTTNINNTLINVRSNITIPTDTNWTDWIRG